ncbi:hypothetical protein HOE425_310132 [Hoeflea sp. EC-HK425]|nr:hypothetical protein HOE425_310132 [Hoeflea sp. EC-HK425]
MRGLHAPVLSAAAWDVTVRSFPAMGYQAYCKDIGCSPVVASRPERSGRNRRFFPHPPAPCHTCRAFRPERMAGAHGARAGGRR